MWKLITAICLFATFLILDAAESNKGKFTCHACSYSIWDKQKDLTCVNETELLLPQQSVKCGNYCITSEHWNIRKRQLDSVFRSCSNFVGNICRQDQDAVTCYTSCKGELCNNVTLGGPHEINSGCNKYICPNTANGWKLFSYYKLCMVTWQIFIKHFIT